MRTYLSQPGANYEGGKLADAPETFVGVSKVILICLIVCVFVWVVCARFVCVFFWFFLVVVVCVWGGMGG
jgi:hypothetical protein